MYRKEAGMNLEAFLTEIATELEAQNRRWLAVRVRLESGDAPTQSKSTGHAERKTAADFALRA